MESTKIVRCRDLGFDCNGVVSAKTEEELMGKVKEHARDAHNLDDIPDELAKKVKSVMLEE